MKLMTGEKIILSHYVMANEKQRAEILQDAKNDPTVSGPLIKALEAVESVL